MMDNYGGFSDQPIPDPSEAHGPEYQYQIPQADLNMPPPTDMILVDASLEAPQADEAYLDTWDGAPMGVDDLVVNELPDTPSEIIQGALPTPGIPTVAPYLSLMSEGVHLSGLHDIDYPEVIEPNVSKDPPVQHVDPCVPRSVPPYEEKGWGRNLGGPVEHHEPGNEPSGAYRTVSPPAPPIHKGRGFNPNLKSHRRTSLSNDVKDDVVCPHCGWQGGINNKCGQCSRNVSCRSCGEPVGIDEKCWNQNCCYHGHTNDDPRCGECHEFIAEGEVLCEECKKKWPYAPLRDWSDSVD